MSVPIRPTKIPTTLGRGSATPSCFFELVRRGEIVTTELITHRFPWQEAPQAYELLMREREKTGIVLLDWR